VIGEGVEVGVVADRRAQARLDGDRAGDVGEGMAGLALQAWAQARA
jgi:hypothetical protein